MSVELRFFPLNVDGRAHWPSLLPWQRIPCLWLRSCLAKLDLTLCVFLLPRSRSSCSSRVGVYLGGEEIQAETSVPYTRVERSDGERLPEVRIAHTDMVRANWL